MSSVSDRGEESPVAVSSFGHKSSEKQPESGILGFMLVAVAKAGTSSFGDESAENKAESGLIFNVVWVAEAIFSIFDIVKTVNLSQIR